MAIGSYLSKDTLYFFDVQKHSGWAFASICGILYNSEKYGQSASFGKEILAHISTISLPS